MNLKLMQRLILVVGLLLMLAARETSAQATARDSGEWDRLGGFNVVLVLGSQYAGLSSEGIPPAAAKALADLKDFLPYKSYRVLDSQWTMTRGSATSRLSGAGKEYSLEVHGQYVYGVQPAKVMINRFRLTDGVSGPVDVAALERARDEVNALAEKRAATGNRLSNARSSKAPKEIVIQFERAFKEYAVAEEEARNRLASAESVGRRIIDTSLAMDLGETVVVGTSRLQGDTALIVLLTAVPRKPAAAGAGGSR